MNEKNQQSSGNTQSSSKGILAAPKATAEAGNTPTVHDWANIVSFSPKLYYQPETIEDLKSFLAGAANGFIKTDSLRVLGSLHSCSKICESDSIIDVSKLPKTIEFTENNTLVTASANWTLTEFMDELSKRGKSLSALGGTNAQTLAGVISTNTAPATPSHSIYELLNWVEYITIDPTTKSVVEKRITKSEPDFAALVCSLGAIGIITKVQFRTVDELFFAVTMKIIPMKEALNDLDATSARYDFWRVNWIPDSDKALLWAAKQIPRDQADINGDYSPDESENVLSFIFTLWDRITKGAAGPLLDNTMEFIYKTMATFYNLNEVNITGPFRNMLPVDRRAPLHVAMAEWSFNPKDLHRVLDLCKEYFHQNGWPNIPTEIELTKTDSYYMSPWNWNGLDYIVKINFMYLTDICTEQEKAEVYVHLENLWNLLIQEGIPFKAHWGKINFMDQKFVEENFALTEFSKLVQPLFLNPYLAARIKV